MTKLDLVLEKFHALPEDRQDAVVREFMFIIEDEVSGRSALTDEQWAEVEAELANEDPEEIPHAQVVREMRAKYGE